MARYQSVMPSLSILALGPFTTLDLIALVVLVAAWIGIGTVIERRTARRLSVSMLMIPYRREWMRQTITREPRVFDSMILSNLRQGTAFFASTCMIALGGGFALIGNVDQLAAVASDLPLAQAPVVVYEVKLLVVMAFLGNAFLKFVWANRVFGYCAVVMGAIPNDATDPHAVVRADQAADLNISAARAFNRGLRSVYFALGALAWLIGPVALLAATAFTLAMLWRREFASATRATLLRDRPGP